MAGTRISVQKKMLDILIHALGGHTKHEMEKMALTCDAWRTRATASETTVELFKEIMTRERERSEKLEKQIFGDGSKTQKQDPPTMNPVGQNKVSSWPRIRRELENQHRVKNNAQVSREEIEKTIRSEQ